MRCLWIGKWWNKNNNEQRTFWEKKNSADGFKNLKCLEAPNKSSKTQKRETCVDGRPPPVNLRQLWHLKRSVDVVLRVKQKNFGFSLLTFLQTERLLLFYLNTFMKYTHVDSTSLSSGGLKRKYWAERGRKGKGREEREKKWVKCQWVVLEVRTNSLWGQKDPCGCNSWMRKSCDIITSWSHWGSLYNVKRFNKGVEWRETD